MKKEFNEKILGYKHLHYIFDPVFRINGDDLYYKGKLVKWEDIESVQIKEGISSYYGFGPRSLLRGPRTIVILKSGLKIPVLCDLTRETKEITFRISQLSDEYKWLRDFILRHIPEDRADKVTKE
jgi:hypothetical protein